MRVCHITSMHPFNDVRIFQRACRGLAREGLEVVLIATAPESGVFDGVKVIALNARTRLFRRVFSSFQAFRLALKVNADVFHFHDPDLLPWMILLKLAGRKVIYDVHENYAVRFYQWRLLFPGFFSRFFDFFEKFSVSFFDGVIVVSESMASLFMPHSRRLLVVYNCPDLISLKGIALHNGKKKRIIYSSGEISSERACFSMVDAMPKILEKFPDSILRFAGKYVPAGFDRALLGRAKAIGVEKNIELFGVLPWRDNMVRNSEAYLGCVLFVENPNAKVALPNRLFEYMFCGIPIIAEDFPDLRDIVEETGCGLLVDSKVPDEFAGCVLRLFQDWPMAKRMGENGRKAVLQKYNFNLYLEKMIKFYESIVGGNRD